MHLSEERLNEYLDHEISSEERAPLESHLSTCKECAARLAALQDLFAEIESLPDVELSKPIAAPVARLLGQSAPRLPRWLTLTATLQATCALIALIMAAPFVANLLPAIEMPSSATILLKLQSQWTAWLDLLSTFQIPSLPQLPALDISSLMLTLTLAGASILWLVGNGLLLRRQLK